MGHALNKKSQEDCFPAVLRQSKAALNSTNMKSTVGCLVLKHVLNTLHATVSTGTPHTSGIYKSRVNNEWQFKDEGLGAMFYVQKEADGENIKSRENVDNKAKENKKYFSESFRNWCWISKWGSKVEEICGRVLGSDVWRERDATFDRWLGIMPAILRGYTQILLKLVRVRTSSQEFHSDW